MSFLGGLYPNTLDVIKVKYGQKNGRIKTVTYKEFLSLPASELSPKEQELQKAMAKLYQVNDRVPPLFKKFPNWRPNKPLTIDASSIPMGDATRAFFTPNDNTVSFMTTAFSGELFSTLVHELKHAEDCTKDCYDLLVIAEKEDGLLLHQEGVLSESRARAAELAAVMADCLDRKLSLEEFRKEIQNDSVYRYVNMIMPEVERMYENSRDSWGMHTSENLQDIQQMATIAILPHFVEGQDYKEGYFSDYNKIQPIKAGNKGLQEFPASWEIPWMYERQLMEVLKASFPNNKPIESGASKIVSDVFEDLGRKTDFSFHLREAVGKQDVAAVKSLINTGADINYVDENGYFSFHLAASRGNVEIINALINAGANVNQRSKKDGSTPLMFAIWNNQVGAVKALIEARANVNQENMQGNTCLDFLVSNLGVRLNNGEDVSSSLEMIRMVVDNGGVVNIGVPEHVQAFLAKSGIALTPNQQRWSSNEKLFAAAANGDEAALDALIYAGEEADKRDKNGKLPIHYAAQNGYPSVVKKLLREMGPWTNMRDNSGKTPFHYAAQEGHVDVIKVVLGNWGYHHAWKGELYEKDNSGKTPLHYAAAEGNLEVVALLSGNGDEDIKDLDGRTALHYAAMHGHVEVVKSLIHEGADSDKRDKEGENPLDMVCYVLNEKLKAGDSDVSNLLEIARILKKDWADFNKPLSKEVHNLLVKEGIIASWEASVSKVEDRANRKDSSKTDDRPAPQAAPVNDGKAEKPKGAKPQEGKIPTVNQGNKNGVTPLMSAAEEGDVATIEALIKQGANVNQGDKHGVTALLIAAIYGQKPAVEALIKHGANVDLGNDQGLSPLIAAAANGYDDVVDVLVKHGANMNQGDKNWNSPLFVSAKYGQAAVVEVLLKHGPNVNQGDKHFQTPLLMSASNGHVAIVDMLIKHGANVNQGNNSGVAPLLAAAAKGHVAIVDMLIKHGANVNQGEENGWTPLLMAARSGHVAVVDALIKQGADVNLGNKNGMTPLYNVVDGLNEKLKAGDSDISDLLKVVKILKQNGAEFNKTLPKEVQELFVKEGIITPDEAKKLQTLALSTEVQSDRNASNTANRLASSAALVNDGQEEVLTSPKRGRGRIS